MLNPSAAHVPTYSNSRGTLRWLLQLGYTTARLFNQNGLQNHAAATAFYFLLSATPLLLLLSYAAQWLGKIAENSVPATILMAALYEQMQLDRLTALGVIPRQTQLTAGGVGLLTLLLSSRGLVNAVQGAFRIIFPDQARRNFIISWVLPLIILPILFLLMGLAGLSQVTLSFLAHNDFIGVGNALILQVLNFLVGFFMVWALLFSAYWRLPRRHPSAITAASFALAAATSLSLLFFLFSAFFSLKNYHSLYGALGGVIFVLIAAYSVFLIVYFWAQALYAYSRADVTALEKMFLAASNINSSKLERFVFSDTQRLLEKYGQWHPAGHVLIREGENSRDAYFLYAGQAAVYKNTTGEQRRLGELHEGQLFGEMAYLLNEPRTASVIAQSELTVLVFSPGVLEELMRSSAPLSRHVIDTLCQRLEKMNLKS